MPDNPNTGSALGGLQYDEQGRPYFLLSNGRRNYVSPVAMGQDAPSDDTGLFQQRPRWNPETAEYETPFDWGNALNIGVAGLFGAGIPHAVGAFGGAGGGGAASASPLLGEGGVGAGLPTGGMTPGLIGAGVGAGTGAAAGLAGAAAGGGIGDLLKRVGMTAGMMGIGQALGGGAGTKIPPEIQQIL